ALAPLPATGRLRPALGDGLRGVGLLVGYPLGLGVGLALVAVHGQQGPLRPGQTETVEPREPQGRLAGLSLPHLAVLLIAVHPTPPLPSGPTARRTGSCSAGRATGCVPPGTGTSRHRSRSPRAPRPSARGRRGVPRACRRR